MKKHRKTIIITGIAVLLLATITAPLLFSSEKIGFYEFSAMIKAKANNEVHILIPHSNMHFPLPNGATPFENKVYPATILGKGQYLITTEALKHYLNTTLPQSGLSYERMGSLLIIQNADNTIRADIATAMFTRNFMRITVHY